MILRNLPNDLGLCQAPAPLTVAAASILDGVVESASREQRRLTPVPARRLRSAVLLTGLAAIGGVSGLSPAAAGRPRPRRPRCRASSADWSHGDWARWTPGGQAARDVRHRQCRRVHGAGGARGHVHRRARAHRRRPGKRPGHRAASSCRGRRLDTSHHRPSRPAQRTLAGRLDAGDDQPRAAAPATDWSRPGRGRPGRRSSAPAAPRSPRAPQLVTVGVVGSRIKDAKAVGGRPDRRRRHRGRGHDGAGPGQGASDLLRAGVPGHPGPLRAAQGPARARQRLRRARHPVRARRGPQRDHRRSSPPTSSAPVGPITAEELHALGAPYDASSQVGQTGLEEAYERRLAGTPKTEIVVHDAAGDATAALANLPRPARQPVRTSLDPRVAARRRGGAVRRPPQRGDGGDARLHRPGAGRRQRSGRPTAMTRRSRASTRRARRSRC